MFYDKLTLYVLSDEQIEEKRANGESSPYKYLVYNNVFNHAAFRTESGLHRWLEKRGLRIGKQVNERSYVIEGAYEVVMVDNRQEYLHLPQIAVKANGSMVRAYRKNEPDRTIIYIVKNYPERFTFDHRTKTGRRYLEKFFWAV